MSPPLPSIKKVFKSPQGGILPTPLGRGIRFKENVHVGKSVAGKLCPPPTHGKGKGKGKLLITHPILSDSSSYDEATILAPLVPLHHFEPKGFEVEVASENHSPICSPAPLSVFCPSGVEGAAQNVLPQATGPAVPLFS